eukprot:TRINITY_DN4573_c0_g1_i1.p1 TRINITY_DN4573_c0_g1~~TRINITY_DN4573_c0_g1_i1.p1  ORF type:complete len:421 (-),score=84.04 TRINITY_DN4573_c0_g1_i1:236-1498(-)
MAEVIDYPEPIEHEITARDGTQLFLLEWKLEDPSKRACEDNKVLLFNGYATESFSLRSPVGTDFVRCLLKAGFEPWILELRYSGRYKYENFTIDDFAKHDIPAAIAKIAEIQNRKFEEARVHLLGHCIGGVSIHMTILGGYVPASAVASILCTSSSHFFIVNQLALMKSVLPLMQISMFILGRRTVVPTVAKPAKITWRQSIISALLQVLPSTQRCDNHVCQAYSGTFGSIFWHENVAKATHDVHFKHRATQFLAMSGLPQVRKILLAARIVDAKGNPEPYDHPERLAVPTTYISGGKPILVLPETSRRANEYMREHHPEFEHERVVVPGYGHQDMLIGKDMEKDIFPHVLRHLTRVTTGNKGRVENPVRGFKGNYRGTDLTTLANFVQLLFIQLLVLILAAVVYAFKDQIWMLKQKFLQ